MKALKIECILLLLLLPFGTANAVQTSTHTEQKSVEIELDSSSDDLTKEIDLSAYSISTPEVCKNANVGCKEHTKVYLRLVKTWEITTVSALTDKKLSSTEYATYYPNLDTTKPITKNSDPKDIMLLQRALYERGILPTLPTGRYGAMTELSVLHFNQIKGLADCSSNASQATTATLLEINAMKERMKDASYLATTRAPELDRAKLCSNLQNRVDELERFITAANQGKIRQTVRNTNNTAVDVIIEGQTDDTGVEIDGFVKIQR
jgi:hypothetical protein